MRALLCGGHRAGFGLAVVLVTLAACARESAAPRPPDVVLVVVDTLRADRLSCYGYPRATSPFLDRLAAEGALFEDHTAQFSWTVPSMASLFTGRYLPLNPLRVPDGVTTLAEVFQDAGYTTIGVVANQLLEEPAGFARGFDHFDSSASPLERADEDNSRTMAELIDDLRAPLAEALDGGGAERPPLFLYVHPMDPHHPYEAWPEYVEDLPIHETVPFSPPGWHLAQLAAVENRHPEHESARQLHDMALERGRYDLEVRWLDGELARLFGELDDLGLLERAVVAVCSDHGEGLWDHKRPLGEGKSKSTKAMSFFYQTHGWTLHQEIVATPLILWGEGVPAGLKVGESTENIDLFPTLLALCGLRQVPGLHGRSAQPLLQGQQPQWRDFTFSVGPRGRASVREVSTGLKLHLGRGGLSGKLRAPQLYDLVADPLERDNLASRRPEDVERMRAELEAWLVAHPMPAGGDDDQLSPEFLENLRRLGYTGEHTED